MKGFISHRLSGLLVSGLCAFAQVAPALAEDGSGDDFIYANGRFGFSFRLPADYVISPPPGNNDGRTFRSYDGKVEILAYAGYLREDFTTEKADRLRYLKDGGAEVTYQKDGAGWFVVSGYDSNGSIFYRRTIETEDCFGATIAATVSITYPPDDRDRVEPYLAWMTESLRGCEPSTR